MDLYLSLNVICSVIKGEIDNNNDYRQIPEIIEVNAIVFKYVVIKLF